MTNEELIFAIDNMFYSADEQEQRRRKMALQMVADMKDNQYKERIAQLEQNLIDANCRCEQLQMNNEDLNYLMGKSIERIEELVSQIKNL